MVLYALETFDKKTFGCLTFEMLYNQSSVFKRSFNSIFFISQDIRVSETATPNADVDEISKVACK